MQEEGEEDVVTHQRIETATLYVNMSSLYGEEGEEEDDDCAMDDDSLSSPWSGSDSAYGDESSSHDGDDVFDMPDMDVDKSRGSNSSSETSSLASEWAAASRRNLNSLVKKAPVTWGLTFVFPKGHPSANWRLRIVTPADTRGKWFAPLANTCREL